MSQSLSASEASSAETPWIGPAGQRMRRLELHLTYHCPERCVFCSEEHRMRDFSPYPVTFARVATVLREQASRGVESVHFTGGEPTIHPDFVAVLRLAKKLGMRTSIGTIGTRLSDPDFADAAMPWLDEALFSIHGPDAATHDAHTRRPGSFARVTRAVENTRRKPGFRPFVNTVVTADNVTRLPETTTLARALGATLLIVSNCTPEGAGDDSYPALTPRLADLAAAVAQVIAAAGPTIVRFFGVPMCVLGPLGMYSNDLHWNPRVTVEWAAMPGKVSFSGVYSWTPERRRTYAPACRGCALSGVCYGVFGRYLETFGDGELAPVEAE